MKSLLLISIFLISIPVFADYRQRELEYKAINRSWYENECFVSVAAGTYKEYNWSALNWFSVNVCSNSSSIIEVD